MNEKKMQQWAKWHNRGYYKFMLLNMAGVCAFYGFTGTIAVLQLSMNKPKGTSLLTIIVPGILIIAVLIPVAVLFMHITWKVKEKQYKEYLSVNQTEESTSGNTPAPAPGKEDK